MFAAGVPICQAYASEWITDKQLEQLREIPLWFVHATNDPVVLFEKTAKPLVERLEKLGNMNVYMTIFDKIVDTTGNYTDEAGKPYEYNGHWSWIPVFNDEVANETHSLYEWLNMQSK